MSTLTVLFTVGVALSVVWSLVFGGRLPRSFRERNCQGRAWRVQFPQASKAEIRDFVRLFVSAFAFSDREMLRLSPNDQPLAIYRAMYPRRWMPDALEFETFSKDLESRYGLPLGSVWHDSITLGELFSHAHAGARR